MTRIYIAMEDALIVLQGQKTSWKSSEQFTGTLISCIDADPHRPERLYCGTNNKGLWYSENAGVAWHPVGEGITHDMVTAVAVSASERKGAYGVVWAGTEPSALFRSENGGNSWQERPSLLTLPSKPTWSFPPRPYTHHVRWIQADPDNLDLLFVAIERGGVMRSLDKGVTWEDRKPGAQIDGHTLRMHTNAPGRLYEAAGGESPTFRLKFRLGLLPVLPSVIMREEGYAETRDEGTTWKTIADGLDHNHYLWSLAIDPGDPDTILASAAVGPIQAHRKQFAESYIIRRTGNLPWQRVNAGLFAPKGALVAVLASNEAEPGVFYAANNKGVFRSGNAGQSWQKLVIPWPDRYRKQHIQGIVAIG